MSDACIERNDQFSIPMSRRRSLPVQAATEVESIRINPKIEPPSFANKEVSSFRAATEGVAAKLLTTWKLTRYLNSEDQNTPRFVGWIINNFRKNESQPTTMTYMSPIETPITDYVTFVKMFKISRKLAEQSNMLYTHITLDVGAAIKAYHVIWNNPTAWSDIVIHLGDFHAMMAFFGVIGKFVEGSGFEEIAFQTGICSSGNLSKVLSGKHYNRCWKIHEAFAEALERIFIETYITDVPNVIRESSQGSPDSTEVIAVMDRPEVQAFMKTYNDLKADCLNGEFGKTAQFWMKYISLVDRQHMFHYAVNTNDACLRLQMWKESIPMCFSTNRIHYARYGSFYLKSLESLDITHPGSKDEMKAIVSVRRNTQAIGQAIDMAGEQSYMKSAKTAGKHKEVNLEDIHVICSVNSVSFFRFSNANLM